MKMDKERKIVAVVLIVIVVSSFLGLKLIVKMYNDEFEKRETFLQKECWDQDLFVFYPSLGLPVGCIDYHDPNKWENAIIYYDGAF